MLAVCAQRYVRQPPEVRTVKRVVSWRRIVAALEDRIGRLSFRSNQRASAWEARDAEDCCAGIFGELGPGFDEFSQCGVVPKG